ncbi:MAG TPA: phosphotransferase [Thermoanaerobaculia bacterium]|nr:phosphotransferase [Thermoanaerobaculia bacterium]
MTISPSLPADAAKFLTGRVGEGWTVQPLLGDASTRRYFRVQLPDGGTRMLAYYAPELREQLRRFLAAYDAVSPHARVPEVLAYDDACVLQTDVGDRTLFDLLHQRDTDALSCYARAIEIVKEFQRAGPLAINPPFDAAFFLKEMEMTREFYVQRLMGVTRSDELKPLFIKLAENIAQHPYVLCHRDYHGQNLHLFNQHIYLIDYQDLRMGPDTYDVASLLRDRGVAEILGSDRELELVDDYGADRHRYFETLLQRSLKILGTFARQPIERGRLHYLEFIPSTLSSVRRCLAELPELAPLARLFPMDFSLDHARERLKGTPTDGPAQDHAPAR